MRCGVQDSFTHLLSCSGLGQPPDDGSPDELIGYLVALVRDAARGAPVVPIRFPLLEVEEISLTAEGGRGEIEQPVSDASVGSLSSEVSDEDDHENTHI